jgi:signal transduction histidine kinase
VLISALVIAIFQVGGTFGASHNQPDRKSIDVIAMLLVLAGPAALAVRDRWPLLAAAVAGAAADIYIGLGYPYGPIFVSVAVALFVTVQTGHRRASWLVTAAAYAGYVIATTLDPRRDGRPPWTHLTLVAGWLAVVWVVSDLVRTRREQYFDRRRAEEEEQLRKADERRLRVAQELHDVLAHNISLINVQASVALHLIEENPDHAETALLNIKNASREALQELRSALDLLRDGDASGAPRSPAPRLADIETLVAGVRTSGLDVRLEVVPPAQPLPASVELATYRIVQEALTNVTRHSGARGVDVRVVCADDVDIEVVDDGRGGPANAGNGITGMRQRAASLGGTLEAGPRLGKGFHVTAHLPVRDP